MIMKSGRLKLERNLTPDQFLLWWFDHAEAHGLATEYRTIFYSRYFDAQDRIGYVWEHFARRMDYFSRMDLEGKQFLDVGCGPGTEVLWAALRGANTTGIELHQLSLQTARKRLEILKRHFPVSVTLLDRNLLELEGQFDFILLRETFHHLEPRERVVEKLAQLLSDDGVLVIEETNGLNPIIQLKYLLIRGRNTITTKRRDDGVTYLFGNERITTARNLDGMFSKVGIAGRAEHFRLLPTALARIAPIARACWHFERMFKDLLMLRPFYLHYSWVGKREPKPHT